MEYVKNVLRKDNIMIKPNNIVKTLTILLLVSVILRFCFVILSFNHNCTHDDNCPICTLIHNIENDLKGFNPNLLELIITLMMLLVPVSSVFNNKTTDKKKYTLIGLKVELLN